MAFAGAAAWLLAARTDRRFRAELLLRASLVSNAIDAELMESVRFASGSRELPEFQRLNRQLRHLAGVLQSHMVPAVAFVSIYSIRPHDGAIVFGPESIPEDDYRASPPGSFYKEPPPGLRELFASGESLIVGPYTDEYGTFVTAFVPLVDSSGRRTQTIIGLDVMADEWRRATRAAAAASVAVAVAAMALLLLIVFSLRANRRIHGQQAVLRESDERFRQLARQSRTVTWEVDAAGVYSYVSGVAADAYGYPPRELIGRKTLFDLHPETGREAFKAEVMALFATRVSFRDMTRQVLTRSGGGVWVSTNGLPRVDEHGVLIGYRGTDIDITERKQAEVALADEAARRRILVEQSRDGIVVLDEAGRVHESNQKFAEMLGYSLAEMSSLSVYDWEFMFPREQTLEMIRTIDEKGDHFETRHRRKDGTTYDAEISTNAAHFAGRKLILCVCRDVTERHRAEQELRRLSKAIEQTADAVVIMDRDWKIQYVNPAFERITGYAAAEVIDREPSLLSSGKEDPSFYSEINATVGRGEVWTGRITNRRKDGGLFEEEMSVSPVRDQRGEIATLIAVKRDITREVALQEQLNHAQRLEAVGKLAGGIAHDFNNLLQALTSQLAVLRLRLGGTAATHAELEEVDQLVKRGAMLTRQLLLFARREATVREPLDLALVVRDAATLLRRVVRENVAILTELPAGPLPVLADRGQLDQILMNLAVNASDAMPDGGTLTLRADGGAGTVRLRVSDTGHGIPAGLLVHMFEPFFTTKSVGKGTGLGLSVVHGIVIAHGGTVAVESTPGSGATFTVTLPRHTGPASLATSSDVAESPSGRGERILLVEDEDGARRGLAEILGALGYAVTAAASGEEAATLSTGQAWDLLLTDSLLPGISGADLAVTFCERWPRLRVILMSGYAAEDVLDRVQTALHAAFLQKPFDVATLARVVRRTLDGGAGAEEDTRR